LDFYARALKPLLCYFITRIGVKLKDCLTSLPLPH
jgi:hypothetical protein